MGVSIITPTGDRPEALTLLAGYIQRQTYTDAVQWIVVDDGEYPFCPHGYLARPIDCASFELTYVRRDEPNVKGGSLNRNMIRGLQVVKHEHVAIMEDDDWYHPTYLEVVSRRLQDVELFGESGSLYYNVQQRRWRKIPSTSHASLCQTSFRASLIPQIDQCCRVATPFIDLHVWKIPRVKKRLQSFFNMCVGIKGMPGRGGYGVGHRKTFGTDSDGNLVKLASLIGRDVARYAPHAEFDIPTWASVNPQYSRGRCLVIGKGPTMNLGLAAQAELVVGLNHVCRERRVHVAHAIDIDVVHDLGETLINNCGVLVMPWHPHEKFKHSKKTLYDFTRETPVLRRLAEQGRLLTYYASIHEGYRTRPSGETITQVRAFSAEAVVDLLIASGYREICTAGVDGGLEYSQRFADLAPLRNSQTSFDSQWPGIRRSTRLHRSRVVPMTTCELPAPPVALVHVPKCAGSSIRDSLIPHLTSMHSHELRDEAPRLVYGHSSADEMRVLFPDCRLLGCVRHPVERLVSLYRFWSKQANKVPVTDPRVVKFLRERPSLEDFAWAFTDTLQGFIGDPSRFELIIDSTQLDERWVEILELVGLPPSTPHVRSNVTPSAVPTPLFDRRSIETTLKDEIEFYTTLKQ